MASTEMERMLAYEADLFPFEQQFAVELNNFVIVLSFCLIYPVVLLPGTLLFGCRVRVT